MPIPYSILFIVVLIAGAYFFYFTKDCLNSLNHSFFPVYSLDELEVMRLLLTKTDKSLKKANQQLSVYQLNSGKGAENDKHGYKSTVEKYCSALVWFQMAQAKLNCMREANIEVLNGKKVAEVRERCDAVIGRMWGQYHQNKTEEMIADWFKENA